MDNRAEHWEAEFVTDGWNDLVDTSLSEVYIILIVFSIIGVFEAICGFAPFFINFWVDVNHQFENQLEQALEKVFVLFYDAGNSLNHGNVELDWLLSNIGITEIVFKRDFFCLFKDLFKFALEEFWLDFSNFIEFDHCILQNSLFVPICSFPDDIIHVWDQRTKLFRVSLLNALKIVRQCLQGTQPNVEVFVIECFLEESHKVVLILVHMLSDVSKQAVEDLKSSINLDNDFRVNKLE